MKRMRMISQMRSEQMAADDLPQVAELLGNAFADKFTEETPLSKQTAKKLMKLLWLEETQVFGMQPYVLKEGNEVVAAYGVTGNQKKTLTLSFIAKVLAALHKIGVRQLFTFARVGLETSRTPDKDELYIAFIAVRESRRNESIGHRVMEDIDALKVSKPGIRKLSLYVLKDNEPAKHLYTKYGFKFLQGFERPKYFFMVKTVSQQQR